MNEEEFFERVRVVVEQCLPSEADAFELAGPEMIHDIFRGRSIKKSTAGGDSEFIDIKDVKTMLEFIPLMHACYMLLKHKTRLLNRAPTASPEELIQILHDSGVPPRTASVAVTECRELLLAFVV